jgi:hypothetical protein
MSGQRQATGSSADEQPAAQDEQPPRPPGAVRPPFSQMERPVPVPAHILQSDQYVWYEVTEQDDQRMAQKLPVGSYLLVKKAVSIELDSTVIIRTSSENYPSGMTLKMYGAQNRTQIYKGVYLCQAIKTEERIEYAKFAIDPNSGILKADINERRQLEVDEEEMVGVVIGMWQPDFYFEQA